tara:strand:- start:228 stop:647 length:420 start_codon:yes stop_codon:yes gene_type:complete
MTKLWDTLKNKIKTIHELSKEFPNKTYRELEKYRDADRNEEARQIITQQENEELKADQGKEIDYHRYWKKRAQEAEGELSILKGIETNRVKEAQARSGYLQDELDRIKRENNDLHNKVAALLDAVDPAETIKKARESGL